MINIFSGEMYGVESSYKITSLIWGEPHACERLENEIDQILKKKNKSLKSIESNKLSLIDWSTFLPIYQEIFNFLMERIYKSEIFLLIDIISREKLEINTMALKKGIIEAIKYSSSFDGSFGKINDNEIQKICSYIPLLVPLMMNRDSIGDNHSVFQYYPEKNGLLLSLDQITDNFHVFLPSSVKLDLLETVCMIGDIFLKPLISSLYIPKNIENIHSTHYQYLEQFLPTNFESSFIIHICKIISHLTTSFIEHIQKEGFKEPNNSVEAALLERHFQLSRFSENISLAFNTHRSNVYCSDPDLWLKIIPIK